MEATKRIAKNTGILYARMGITVLISLYTTRLTLNALGVADFGIFNVMGGIILMLAFLNASMTEATQRFISHARGSKDLKRVKQIFNASIVMHIFIAIALFLILETAGYFAFEYLLNLPADRIPAAKAVYHFLVLSTLFTVISVPYDAVINARENMFLFAILGIVESVIKLIIAWYLSFTSHDKLITYGVLTAVLALVLLLARVLYCPRIYKECRISFARPDQSLVKEMTGFAGWALLGTSVTMMSSYGQGIVLNMFFGTAINAAQGIANQVSGQLGAFATTMLRALNPTIAKSEGAGDRDMMMSASIAGSKVSFFLLMLMCVPVLVEMPYIFRLWLKNVPDYAIVFCQLLLLRNLIEQLFYTLIASISAVGQIKGYQVITSVLSCLPLPVCYFLFSQGAAPYVIYLVFILYSFGTSVNILYFARKHCGLSIAFFSKEVIARCVASLLITLFISSVPTFFMDESFARLSFVLASSMGAFITCVWFIGLNETEQALVKRMTSALANSYTTQTKRFIAAYQR